jgi:hypothetical protein
VAYLISQPQIAGYSDGSFPNPAARGPGTLNPRVAYNWSPGLAGEEDSSGMTASEVVTSLTSSIASAAGTYFAADAAKKQAKYGAREAEATAAARAELAAAHAAQARAQGKTTRTAIYAVSGILVMGVLFFGYRASRRR